MKRSLKAPAVSVRVVSADEIRNAQEISHFKLRGNVHLVVHTPRKAHVTVKLINVRARGNMFHYRVLDSGSRIVTKGLVGRNTSIEFTGGPGQLHHVYTYSTGFGPPIYSLRVHGAPYALDQVPAQGRGVHFQEAATPLYFHVPEQVEKFGLTLHSSSPGETAAARVYDPTGKLMADMTTVSGPRDIREFKGQPGFWKVSLMKAKKGYFDDAYISQSPELSGYFTVDPKLPLIVQPLKEAQ